MSGSPLPPPSRKQKTLIVGPKAGTVAVLARLAHAALVVLRLLPKLGVAFAAAHTAAFLLFAGRRRQLLSSWKAKLVALYLWSEAGFLAAMWARRELTLQRQERERVPHLTAEERAALFQRCLDCQAVPMTTFLEQWFEPVTAVSELGRGNLQELIAWAFFHESHWERDMTSAADRAEMERMVCEVEARLPPPHSLQPGTTNANVKLLKFTDLPVLGQHRSWLVYFVVHFAFQLVLAPAIMRWRGYVKLRSGDLTYWYRRGSAQGKPPVVFLHGIGVGILPYLSYLALIEREADGSSDGSAMAGRAILVPEIQAISQRLLPDDLHCRTFALDLNHALQHVHGHRTASLVAHSYGTFCAKWMLSAFPDSVASVTLIDPVCLLLHSTDVLVNMIYHTPLPNNSVEYTLDYIMRGEVSLQHTLLRRFHWFRNVLFLDEVTVPVSVCLADNDPLVPSAAVRDYVQAHNSALRGGEKYNVDLVWLERCDHAGFLFNAGYLEQCCALAARTCAREK